MAAAAAPVHDPAVPLWYADGAADGAPVRAGPPVPRGGRGFSLTKAEWTRLILKRMQKVAEAGPLQPNLTGKKLLKQIDHELAREENIAFRKLRTGFARHAARDGEITAKHGPAKGHGGAPRQTNAWERMYMVDYVDKVRSEEREVPRREVQAMCLKPENKLTKVKSVDPVSGAASWSLQMRLRFPVGIRTVGRILWEDDLKARVPAAKEQYTEAEKASRLAYANAGEARPLGFFDGVCYTDEVRVIWARGATLRRLLGKRVRFVYRRPGERFHPDCIKARHMKNNYDGISLKFFVAVAWGQLVINADAADYLHLSESARGQIDQNCYARYLEHLAHAYRAKFNELNEGGLTDIDTTRITLLQDNWRVHTAPESLAAAVRKRIDIIEGQPTRSPDLNPIENVFAELARRLDILYADPAKANVDRAEFVDDVNETLQAMNDEGVLARICCDATMRKRFAAVKDANGGATRY